MTLNESSNERHFCGVWLAPPVVITSCSLDFFTNNNYF